MGALYGIAKSLALPPLCFIAVAAVGLWLRRRHRRTGRALIVAGLASLYLFSTEVGGGLARALIEPAYVDPMSNTRAQAIVVLGGGIHAFAQEYGRDSVNRTTLARVRYGAWLHRKTGKPILVSGGSVFGNTPPEAGAMRAVLVDELRVPVRWVEDRSRDTYTNAVESHRILAAAGIRTVYLVTHAAHIPRARAVFEQAGLEVVPAGTGFTDWRPDELRSYLPSVEGLVDAHYAFYEAIGYLWYMVRSRT